MVGKKQQQGDLGVHVCLVDICLKESNVGSRETISGPSNDLVRPLTKS